jgi:hypothetical protein
MKKIIFSLLLLIGANVHAQQIEVFGGLNNSIQRAMYQGNNLFDGDKMLTGLNLGGRYNYLLTDILSISGGLSFDTRGSRTIFGAITSKAIINTINIPILLKVQYPMNTVNLYGVFGPYIGSAIWGKFLSKSSTDKYTSKMVFGSEKDYKRFDYGLAFGLGANLNQMSLGFQYDFGIANINPYTSSDVYATNRTLKFVFAYTINQ